MVQGSPNGGASRTVISAGDTVNTFSTWASVGGAIKTAENETTDKKIRTAIPVRQII
jgi:hypothetical protein